MRFVVFYLVLYRIQFNPLKWTRPAIEGRKEGTNERTNERKEKKRATTGWFNNEKKKEMAQQSEKSVGERKRGCVTDKCCPIYNLFNCFDGRLRFTCREERKRWGRGSRKKGHTWLLNITRLCWRFSFFFVRLFFFLLRNRWVYDCHFSFIYFLFFGGGGKWKTNEVICWFDVIIAVGIGELEWEVILGAVIGCLWKKQWRTLRFSYLPRAGLNLPPFLLQSSGY